MTREAFVVGVAGGSGCGKTTVAREIERRLGSEMVSLLYQDSYYRVVDWSPAYLPERHNFDHPDAIDVPLLVRHLDQLRAGRGVEVPVYDFETHRRLETTVPLAARRVVVVEGTLLFAVPEVRARIDLKVFVDVASDLRFIRRLQRDLDERGRTIEGIVGQYLGTVRPMHLEFVQPSQVHADLVVTEGGRNEEAMAALQRRLDELLAARR